MRQWYRSSCHDLPAAVSRLPDRSVNRAFPRLYHLSIINLFLPALRALDFLAFKKTYSHSNPRSQLLGLKKRRLPAAEGILWRTAREYLPR